MWKPINQKLTILLGTSNVCVLGAPTQSQDDNPFSPEKIIGSNSKPGINLLPLNPRSLNNKVNNSFMGLLQYRDIDIRMVSETWLAGDTSVTTAVTREYGYSLVHNPRSGNRGGGTAIVFNC